MNIYNQIKIEHNKLDLWLKENYEEAYGDFYGEMDASYPDWESIEILFERIIKQDELKNLSDQDLTSILFFISRSNELGRMIAWLSQNNNLSNIAALTTEQFLLLSRHAVTQKDDDCDYQLANCFKKIPHSNPEIITLLLGFFNKKASYTKRIALYGLAAHQYPELVKIVINLWNTTDDDWAKLDCLDLVIKYKLDPLLQDKYFSELSQHPDSIIRENVLRLLPK